MSLSNPPLTSRPYVTPRIDNADPMNQTQCCAVDSIKFYTNLYISTPFHKVTFLAVNPHSLRRIENMDIKGILWLPINRGTWISHPIWPINERFPLILTF